MHRGGFDTDLEKILRSEVTAFCRRNGALWKQAAVKTMTELKRMRCPAVFFGGTLRSLLISRLWYNKPGRPRDIDIVVQGAPVSQLRKRFEKIISRETRFGGLQLRRENWQFDVWPLENTWAFNQDSVQEPGFADLPGTTFFNLEAIAVDVWPQRGRTRRIFSGDGQFFDGIRNRVLEVNRKDNPFPGLCVVRALVFASSLDFRLGPRLTEYIAYEGGQISSNDLEEIQIVHYGKIRRPGNVLKTWIEYVSDKCESDASALVSLPLARQLTFWSDEPMEQVRLHIRSLATNRGQSVRRSTFRKASL